MRALKRSFAPNGKVLSMQTSMSVLIVLFICDVILLTEVTERARSRLRKFHPAVFHALGKPALEDSNLTSRYWAFAKFLWWGHRHVNDLALRRLCQIYCLGALAAIGLFVARLLDTIN
jgi:hypothetical protein